MVKLSIPVVSYNQSTINDQRMKEGKRKRRCLLAVGLRMSHGLLFKFEKVKLLKVKSKKRRREGKQ